MRPRAAWIVSLWLAVVITTPPAQSGQAVPVAADPALEARVNALAAELRCLVCQNQSLADSHAELAVDLKNQVREQLRAGRSESQVVEYMTQRYGDFVLYRPPLKASTVLLWVGPLLLVLMGAGLLWRSLRSARSAPRASSLDPAEQARADHLLGIDRTL